MFATSCHGRAAVAAVVTGQCVCVNERHGLLRCQVNAVDAASKAGQSSAGQHARDAHRGDTDGRTVNV